MNRRNFLRRTALLLAAQAAANRSLAAFAQTPSAAGDGSAFSREWLKEEARRLSTAEYRPPPTIPRQIVELAPERYRQIQFRPDQALWLDQDLAFQLRFFHVGRRYAQPVSIHQVIDGRAHPVRFSSAMFDYGQNQFEPPLPDFPGFAGFRIHYRTDFGRDMAAFLGASYFRAVGWQMQYGISARGLGIDTVFPGREEFPLFTAFWIERPARDQADLTVHALLDSPSIAGAYRFIIRPGRTTVMDVEASLFPRKKVRQLGLAPLTSMFHHGENDRRSADDFRPEVHDSDGLALVRGNGERLWRPLANPAVFRVTTYLDENPQAFGLLQRDRNFRNYQDDRVYYDRRPNLWVETQGQWGVGAVGLVEIPTDNEDFDNIVAFWSPAESPEPGRELSLAYRLSWGSEIPDSQSPVGRVVATRLGRGLHRQKDSNGHQFVVDFAGGPLDLLTKDAAVEPVITASRGRIEGATAYLVGELAAWRASFDLRPDGGDPVELRCYLRLKADALTETWTYLWAPPR